MKKLAPYLFAFFALLCLAVKPNVAKATHAAGAEIIYEHLGDSTYRFFFKFYRACSGNERPATVQLCLYNPCTNKRWNTTMTLYTGFVSPGDTNGSPVSAGCSDFKTRCEDPNSGLPGYREWWYVCDDSLVGLCDSWRFSVAVNARNPQNNLQNAGAQNLYVETTFNNLYAQGNYSPYYAKKPIPFCCVNIPFGYNNNAVDPDGDSLVHEIINPLGGTSSCNSAQVQIPLNNNGGNPVPPYAIPLNPLQTDNTFVLNSSTGQMNFVPTQVTGANTLTMRTKEYRNGILIGSIMRDIQVQVLPPHMCNSVQVVFNPSSVGSIEGGVYLNGQVEGCVQQPLKFTYTISSPEPDAVLIGEDNHTTNIAGSNVTYTGQRTPNVTGTFQWLPAQPGLYTLIVDAVDSTCRPPGMLFTTTYTIPILIWPHTNGLGDTSICPGDQAQLSVTGGDDFTWSIITGDVNSLPATPTGPNILVNPFQTTNYLVTSGRTPFCERNKDTVVVVNLPSPGYTPMLDDTTCPGVPVLLDPKIGGASPGSGITYTATWTPATFLNSTTGLNVTSTPSADMTYTVIIGASNTVCRSFDTVFLDVLDGFLISNQDGAICVGNTVQITAVGDTRYNYLWKTNDPQGILAFSDPYMIDPLITPSATVGEYNYTLHATYPGCPDSIGQLTIDVQPVPTVQINEDAIVCFGDTMQLNAIVNPPGYSKYIYNWTPASALTKSNVPDPVFAGIIVGENTLVFSTTTNGANCEDRDTIILNVLPSDFMFLSADTAICPGDSVNIHMTGVALRSYFWAANNAIGDVMSADPLVWPSTTDEFVVYGRDTNMCYDTATVRVTVRPGAVVELPDSVRIYPGQSYQVLPGGNASRYSWFPSVGLNRTDIANPLASPEVNTRYTVTAMTEGNCIATDAIDILVADDVYLEVPNAFIPGNSPRSWLKPLKMGDVKLISFKVYNRWGIKVFETKGFDNGWDGTLNGKGQPMGVYVYSIEALTPGGKKISKDGNVTLIR